MTTSKIQVQNGNPALEINGKIVPANAYITYFIEKAHYEDFAEIGYKLFSVPLFFSSRSITEVNEIPPFAPGIFENTAPDFSIVDNAIKQILRACPDAYIFPRVNMSLPLKWERENPDELCDIGNVDQEKRRPCFSSDKWAEDTKKYLEQFLDHIEKSPYKEHICGYQLAGGNTEEWFSFDFLGSIGKRSREKFEIYKSKNGLEGTQAQYYEFLSKITAERICEFASVVKEKTNRRLVVGTFYGYTFETPERNSCHHALGTILKSPDIDFICSPVSYMDQRTLGIDHPCMLPLESLKENGKLYFVENDARSHLTAPLFNVPHFDHPNWMPKEIGYTMESLLMFYARAFIKDHALWWFDMGGGWYDYPPYMKLFADFLKITKESKGKDKRGVSQVAVLIDESACFGIDEKNKAIVYRTCYEIRKQLGLMGAPYDSFLVEDYEKIKDKYKAFILLTPETTHKTLEIVKNNKNCLVINGDNFNITTDELREFLGKKKVHIYSKKDAVIYINKSYLFLHTAEEGKAELVLTENMKLKQIYGLEADVENEVLPKHTGYLFEIQYK